MLEDFIVDLFRNISINKGAVPSKYQQKLQEMLNVKPTNNKFIEVRKSRRENDEEEGRKTTELSLIKDALLITGQEITNRTIDVNVFERFVLLMK